MDETILLNYLQNMGYNQGTNLGYYVGAETLKKAE